MKRLTKAELIVKYPGAPIPFIEAFIRSGYAQGHFFAMRTAWQAGILRAVELARERGYNGLNWDLNKEA